MFSKQESSKAGCWTPALNAVRVRYEPTIFTGASIKFAPPGSVRNKRKHRDNIKPFPTFLMFINGKVIMTGSTTKQKMQESFKKFYSLICTLLGKRYHPDGLKMAHSWQYFIPDPLNVKRVLCTVQCCGSTISAFGRSGMHNHLYTVHHITLKN